MSNMRMSEEDEVVDWSLFTDEEISMILSCLANEVALCCEVGASVRHAITDDARKLRMLDYWSYEGTGHGPHLRSEHWENYFDQTVESIGDKRHIVVN